MDEARLPKRLDDEPLAAGLAGRLAAAAEPLEPGGETGAVRVAPHPALEAALRAAFAAGRIVRGFEAAERVLAAEEKGQAQADRAQGVARGGRVSRLLVLADDGSDRFYREVAFLLRRNAPRVLALRLGVDERGLGGLLFGPDQAARLVLVEHKDAVAEVLLAVAAIWSEAPEA